MNVYNEMFFVSFVFPLSFSFIPSKLLALFPLSLDEYCDATGSELNCYSWCISYILNSRIYFEIIVIYKFVREFHVKETWVREHLASSVMRPENLIKLMLIVADDVFGWYTCFGKWLIWCFMRMTMTCW